MGGQWEMRDLEMRGSGSQPPWPSRRPTLGTAAAAAACRNPEKRSLQLGGVTADALLRYTCYHPQKCPRLKTMLADVETLTLHDVADQGGDHLLCESSPAALIDSSSGESGTPSRRTSHNRTSFIAC